MTASLLLSLIICVVAQPSNMARRRTPSSQEPQSVRTRIVGETQALIDQGFRRIISTSTIAATLHHNADYLERIFRRETGMSIVDAIHQKRIGTARLALRNDAAKNINEIAYECGYKYPAYFHRMFKRLSGFTPREFRNLYSRTHINTH